MGMTTSPRSFKFLNGKIHVLVIVLFAILYRIEASDVCNEGCPAGGNKPGKLVFKAGSVYTYDLKSDIKIYLSGKPDNQEKTMSVAGSFEVYAETDCNYAMKIVNLQVKGPDRTAIRTGADLQGQKIVRFTFANDELTPEICAQSDDTEFGLNVKRALISMLQSADSKSYETDVFGTCPTSFSKSQSGDTLTVIKTKNLNLCGHRETLSNGLITSVIDDSAGVKSTPLLNGDYVSEQRYKSGILENVQLTEDYHYVPFSSGEAGARVKVTTIVKKTKQTEGAAPKTAAGVPRTLLFENPKPQVIPKFGATIEKSLKATLETYKNYVGDNSAAKFSELIRFMQYAKKDELAQLFSKVKAGTVDSNKDLTRKVYLDALFRTGTSDSMDATVALMNELTDKEKRIAYMSFNLVKNVNRDSLPSIAKLIDAKTPYPKEVYLSIGSLLNKYCRKYGCKATETKNIFDKFIRKLNQCKANTREEETTIIAVLKGIRNTNHLSPPIINQLVQCTNDKKSSRIRVAALQTFTAAACDSNVQRTALALMNNREEDAELRIEAYLAYVACPSGTVANEVKRLLDTETVYQVGSYITSHLASIRSSTDPSRDAARQHFANVRTTKRFPVDLRRYSFNREISYSLGSLGLGAGADSNVIYSQKSFLPRSARFNLTGEIFGNSFNIFEVAGRQENLDLLMESRLGPKGFFNTANLQEIYDAFFSDVKQLQKRSVRNDIKQFAKTVNMGNEVNNDIDLDISFKLFGSEMYFLSLGDNLSMDPKEFLKDVQKRISGALNKAKNFDYTYESHSLFLDAELVYPTGVGMPLKLSTLGTGVVRMETGGKFDFKNMKDNPKDVKFNLKLVPSYNFEIKGTISVDGFSVLSGLQLTGTVHSSTGLEIDFKMVDGGKGVDFDVRFPLTKQELFKFDHKIVFVLQERGKDSIDTPLKFTSKSNAFSGCFDQLVDYVGVVVCADYSISTPQVGGAAFPLSGPNYVNAYVNVDSLYKFQARVSNDKPGYRSLEFKFDTPGSKTPRASTLKMEAASSPKYFARVALTSPIQTASVEAGINNNDKEVVFYVEAARGSEKYTGKVGFTKAGNPNHQEYTPILVWNTPSSTQDKFFGYKITGKVVVDKRSDTAKRYTFNKIEVIGDGEPVTVDGWVDVDGDKFSNDLKISKGSANGKFIGNFEVRKRFVNFDLGMTTNFHEYANGKIAFNFDHGDNYFSNKYLVVYGQDLESQTKRVEFYHRYDYEYTDNEKLKSLKIDQKFKAPAVPVNYEFEGDFNKNLVKFDLDIGYQKHTFGSKLISKLNGKTQGDYDVNFAVSLNTHNAKLFMKREIEGGKSKINNRFTTSAGTKAELNGHIGNEIGAKNADINLEGTLVPIEKEEPYKCTLVILLSAKKATSNAKLFVGSTELASYDVNVDRTDDKNLNGVFNMKVKDTIDGKGTFKSNNGKGDGNVLVTLLKVDRKFKVSSTFNIAAPIYDMKTEFFYNFEKENDKKITFDTKNRVLKGSFDSKNTLEVQGDKYVFNTDGTTEGRPSEGKANVKFHLTLPNGREMSGNVEREVRLKQDVGTGNLLISLKDILPNKKTRSMVVTGTLSDANIRSKLFNLVHKITFIDFDGRDVVLSTHFKNVPKGEFKNGAADLNLRGSMLPEVIDLKISADEYCHEHAVYSASAKYGGQFNFNVNGNYYVGTGKKPTTYDIKTVINVPNTQIKSASLQSNGKFIAPQSPTDVYEGQFKVSGALNNKVFSADTTLKGNNKAGSGNLKFNVPDIDPFSADGSYTLNIEDDVNGDGKGTLNVHYGKDKTISVSTDVKVGSNGEDVAVQVGLKTPFDNAKNVDFSFKQVVSGNSNTMRATMKADDRRYALVSHTSLTTVNPKVDIVLTYPNHPDVKFFFESHNLGDSKYNGKLNMENFGDFNLISSAEGSFQSLENYYLIVDIDSPKMQINKVHVEMNSKKGGKGIEFKATEGGKNVISGSADFTVQDQNGKLEIGGQGDFKFYEKQSTGNFKYVRTNFDEKQHKESGFKVVMNGNIDNKKVVAEFKWTNKNFHIQNSICQDNSKCSSIQINSAIDQTDLDFKHNLVVNIDLGSFGYTHDFILTSTTDGSGFRLRHHTFDMQLKNKNAIKYQFKVDLKPEDSSVVLSLPTRQVAVEVVIRIPKDIYGKYDVRVSSYLDKRNSPANVATIGLTADVNQMGNNGVRTNYALKFSHPSLKDMKVFGKSELSGDDMYASGEMTIDIFKNANQAIVIVGKYDNLESDPLKAFNVSSELSVKSQGLGFNYGFTGHAAASLDRRQVSIGGSIQSPTPNLQASIFYISTERNFELVANAFNEKLLQADGQYDLDRHNGKLKATMKYLNTAPFILEGSVSGFNSVKGTFKRDRLLDVTGEITQGKEASLLVTGQNKELFRGRIALDQTHFLKSEYKVDDAQIKEFMKIAQNEISKDAERSKVEIEKRLNDVRTTLDDQVTKIKGAVPDFDRFVAEYKKEGQKVLDELKTDETIKKFIEFYNQFYESIGKTIEEVMKTLIEYVKKVNETLAEFYKDVRQAFNDNILPALKETYTNVERIIMAFAEEAVRLVGDFAQRVVQSMKAFEEDFAKIGSVVSEQFKKIAAVFNKYFDTIRKEANDFYQLIVDNLKTLPGLDEIKAKIKETLGEYIAPDQLSQIVKGISTFLQEIIPVDQFDEFIKNVEQYIDSKLSNRRVNDIEELKKIYVSLMKAVRAVIELIRTQVGDTDATKNNYWFPIPFSFDALKRVPSVSNFRFSPWNFFRNERTQSLRDILLTYRPYAWNPKNFLPPFDKHGTIVDGQHIFTFDGQHMTFPGTCQYILAQDFVNNNFSVVVNLDAGKLKSITLVDKEDFVEVSPGGIVKLNDKATEMPVHKANIHVWRRYYTVSFLSMYGVFVQCGLDMRVCHISVNGYYHGKLRGILGNGNSEPYDDFTLPNNHIATDFAQFGNAYKTTATCADVPFDEHKNEKSDECSSVFGYDSSMKYCYLFVDRRPYMEACEHAVHHSTDKNDAACNMALAYASACRMENIFTSAPDTCVTCPAKRAVGDTYIETAPQKKADVLFVVDLGLGAQTLTDLVQPSVNILRNQLKMRDFQEGNVNIAIVGYRADLKYPHHFTTNGKLDFTGKLTMPDDTDMPKDVPPVKTGNEKLDKALEDAFNYNRQVQEDLGIAADGRAFQEAFKYPFRSNAAKAIVAFRSDNLVHSKNPLKQAGGTLMNTLAKVHGIAVHMVGPLESLKINNEKNNKVIGFNPDSVLLFGKKGKTTELREKLTYDADLGVDLVQANNGYSFTLTNFNETKDKKAFIQHMTAAIADDLARTEYTLNCECELRHGLFAYEKCHQVESRLLPPIVKARG
ncbi:hypothetical protein HA402_015221 [Bradysia odoriphaga]|nr:hypothetical protein HA402_015221 [Bradysia odoriphaga]